MYYPLLRARQFELIALRELAAEGSSQNFISPILEPVNKVTKNLTLAFKLLEESSQDSNLILNPIVGELAGDREDYLNFFVNEPYQRVKPAFRYHLNAGFINDSIAKGNLDGCMIVCSNDIVVSEDEAFKALVESDEIETIVVEDPGRNRSLNNYIKGLGKTYVRLDDLFEKEKNNSAYLAKPAHRLSEEHLYYASENLQGFSDYTVLPSQFSDGGSTPRAVVIHISYLTPDNQIWVRHFTSITNGTTANVQGKFAEASQKAVDYMLAEGLTNSALEELKRNFDEQHYPGLGIVKKIAIKNHLLVVRQYLASI